MAQLGAILDSTLTAIQILSVPHMHMTSVLTMILYVILIKNYHSWYSHTLETTADSNRTPTRSKVTTLLPSMEYETRITSK